MRNKTVHFCNSASLLVNGAKPEHRWCSRCERFQHFGKTSSHSRRACIAASAQLKWVLFSTQVVLTSMELLKNMAVAGGASSLQSVELQISLEEMMEMSWQRLLRISSCNYFFFPPFYTNMSSLIWIFGFLILFLIWAMWGYEIGGMKKARNHSSCHMEQMHVFIWIFLLQKWICNKNICSWKWHERCLEGSQVHTVA